MKNFALLLSVIAMLITTGEVKAQVASEETRENIVVDGLAYVIFKNAKTAAVIPNYYYDDNKEEHLLCAPYAGDIAVPATITVEGVDYTVTELAEEAFEESDITSLALPSSIKKLGYRSISFCTELTKVNIPASVEDIAEGMFRFCGGITDFTLEEGNSHFIMESDMLMTADKTRLIHLFNAEDEAKTINVTLPSTITTIDEYALAACLSVKEIKLHEGLERIGNYAFGFTSLSSIELPASLTYLGEALAAWTTSLKKITVAEGNTCFRFVNDALYNADMTLFYMVLPGNNGIEIAETVTRIGRDAIQSTELETLVIPDNVREIGIQAITGNPRLKTVVIGCGVEETGTMALDENQSLEAIYLRRETPAIIEEDLFEDEYYDKVTLYVPTGTKRAYELDAYWGRFRNIAEYSLTDIDNVKTDTNAPAEQIYGIDGKHRDTLHHGLNIVRSNGKAKKVMAE